MRGNRRATRPLMMLDKFCGRNDVRLRFWTESIFAKSAIHSCVHFVFSKNVALRAAVFLTVADLSICVDQWALRQRNPQVSPHPRIFMTSTTNTHTISPSSSQSLNNSSDNNAHSVSRGGEDQISWLKYVSKVTQPFLREP